MPAKWTLREGHPRREARSAGRVASTPTTSLLLTVGIIEELAHTDLATVLKPRDNVLERSVDEPEGSMPRAIDWAFSTAGTEAPTALSHAVRALTKRWSTFLHNDLEVVKEPSRSLPHPIYLSRLIAR